jgi:hypothetical protein
MTKLLKFKISSVCVRVLQVLITFWFRMSGFGMYELYREVTASAER